MKPNHLPSSPTLQIRHRTRPSPPSAVPIVDDVPAVAPAASLPSTGQKVGYKNPPLETRFKKGQKSANLKGRPKAKKDPIAVLEDAMHREVVVLENGKRRKMTAWEAAVHRSTNELLKGNYKEYTAISKIVSTIASSRQKQQSQLPHEDPPLTQHEQMVNDFIREFQDLFEKERPIDLA